MMVYSPLKTGRRSVKTGDHLGPWVAEIKGAEERARRKSSKIFHNHLRTKLLGMASADRYASW
jgi:hypothetical protein